MKKGNKNTETVAEKNIYTFPVFTLRNSVMYPECHAEFEVGDELSIKSLKTAETDGGMVLLTSLKNGDKKGEPVFSDLHTYGTVCRIEKLTTLSKGRCYVALTGKIRAKIISCVQEQPSMLVNAEVIQDYIIAAK